MTTSSSTVLQHKKTVADREPLIISAAILTTSLLNPKFRAKHILFHIDLMRDIFQAYRVGAEVQFQTVQILRILSRYSRFGWAERISDNGRPVFRLTAKGVVGLIMAFADQPCQLPAAEMMFVQSYIETYSDLIRRHLASMDMLTEAELASLNQVMAPKYVVHKQMRILDQRIADLEFRLKEADGLMRHVAAGQGKNLSVRALINALPAAVRQVVSQHKSFKDWLQEMPLRLAEYEIEVGFKRRQETFYEPFLSALRHQRQFFESLTSSGAAQL